MSSLSSSVTMAADSTQKVDPGGSESAADKRARKRKVIIEQRRAKKVRRNQGKKPQARSHSRTMRPDSGSDCDSDLDLTKELKPIGQYVHHRELMLDHMFRSISRKKLRAMLPETLKELSLDGLKELCLGQLDMMSRKRILRVLDGADPDVISSTGSEDDSSEEETDRSHPGSSASSEVGGEVSQGQVADSTSPHDLRLSDGATSTVSCRPGSPPVSPRAEDQALQVTSKDKEDPLQFSEASEPEDLEMGEHKAEEVKVDIILEEDVGEKETDVPVEVVQMEVEGVCGSPQSAGSIEEGEVIDEPQGADTQLDRTTLQQQTVEQPVQVAVDRSAKNTTAGLENTKKAGVKVNSGKAEEKQQPLRDNQIDVVAQDSVIPPPKKVSELLISSSRQWTIKQENAEEVTKAGTRDKMSHECRVLQKPDAGVQPKAHAAKEMPSSCEVKPLGKPVKLVRKPGAQAAVLEVAAPSLPGSVEMPHMLGKKLIRTGGADSRVVVDRGLNVQAGFSTDVPVFKGSTSNVPVKRSSMGSTRDFQVKTVVLKQPPGSKSAPRSTATAVGSVSRGVVGLGSKSLGSTRGALTTPSAPPATAAIKTPSAAQAGGELSQNQMEILELEMRARAIKAMLKASAAKKPPRLGGT